MDPGPLTPRRLLLMSLARRRHDWDRAADTVAGFAAVMGGSVGDLWANNPYRHRAAEPPAGELPPEVQKAVSRAVWLDVCRAYRRG